VWTCGTCQESWPCPPAKDRLRKRHGQDKVGLSIELTDLLYLAAKDLFVGANLIRANPTALHARFIAWTR
jgi:hypothetical protein